MPASPHDIRIRSWDLHATAGTTRRLVFTAPGTLTSLSVWTGGTVTDVDDLTGATEHPAVLSTTTVPDDTATVDLAVPAVDRSLPLRLAVDGAVVTVGLLVPSTKGTSSPDGTVALTADEVTYALTVGGTVVTSDDHPDLAGHDALGLATQAELDGEATTRAAADTALQTAVDARETPAGAQAKADAAQAAAEATAAAALDAEATTRADADTALDGRLDAVETALPTKADLVGGVVPTAQMPAISIMERVPVADEAARLALTSPGQVQVGDVAVQADTGVTWLLIDVDPSLAASWKAIDQSDAVQSVNGQTGTVVLAKADIGLGNVDNTADLAKPISTATQTALDTKADDTAVVKLTGDQTVAGVKTFSSPPVVPTPTGATQAASKGYVDTAIGNGTSLVGARAYRLGSETPLSLATATVVSVPLTSEEYDTNGFHSTGSNPQRFTIPAGLGGIWTISAAGVFSANSGGRRVVRVMKNGIGPVIRADAPAVATSATVLGATGNGIPLAAGDYIDLEVFQDSGAALTLDGNGFIIHETSTDVSLHDIVAFMALIRTGDRP